MSVTDVPHKSVTVKNLVARITKFFIWAPVHNPADKDYSLCETVLSIGGF